LFRDIVEAKFVKGQRKLLFKQSFAENTYVECDVLKAKVKLNASIPVAKNACRGIQTSKKSQIVKDLLPLMPASRRSFWINLPNSDSCADLLGAAVDDVHG